MKAVTRLFVVVNPTSGRGRARRARPQVERTLEKLGVDYELALTTRSGEATEMAREAVAGGFSRVLAIGGDGLAGEVLNGIVGSDVEFALVPSGTGNDLAGALELPIDPIEAAHLAVYGKAVPIDVGQVNGRYFFQVAGAGFDSQVTKLANDTSWLKGKEVYIYAVLRTLLSFKAASFRITTPRQQIELKAMMVAVGNGPSYGGGMRVTPAAHYDDGLLDVCIVKDVSIPRFLAVFPKVFKGTHIKSDAVLMLTTTELHLEADRAFPIYADGEYVGSLPADITIHPRAISIVAPAYSPVIQPQRKPKLAPA